MKNNSNIFNIIGIVGAGTMGIDLAVDVLSKGMSIILIDKDLKVLERARSKIILQSKYYSLINEDVKPINDFDLHKKNNIFSTSLDKLLGAKYIVENITESISVKKNFYKKMNLLFREKEVAQSYMAINTSCIPIEFLSQFSLDPARVIGLHFMNPVPLTKAVEVVRTKYTSKKCIDLTTQFVRKLKKSAIIVNDGPGFVSNRILMLTINEAIAVLSDGITSAENIDKVFRDCFGYKMGPLETADLIGLDTILDSLNVLYEFNPKLKFLPHPLLKEYVKKNLLGRKTDQGIFSYKNVKSTYSKGKEKIREFILSASKSDKIEDNQPIFSSGLISSLFAMELIDFIGSEFQISIANEDLSLENFSSLNSICKFIESKKV